MANIVVNLMHRPGRSIECYWTDPITGNQKTRSTKTKKDRDAERFRAKLEHQLNQDAEEDGDIEWKTLADRYQREVLASRAIKTLGKFKATRHKLEKHVNPKLARSISGSLVSKFQSHLRDEGLAEATIKSHLATLMACLSWAAGLDLLKKVPAVVMPKRTDQMRGRPITKEEFERMILKLDDNKVCRADLRAEWKLFFEGLWLSGLRLGEALMLRWDSGEIAVTLGGKVPRLKIQANTDKSTKFRILPLAPEFGEFLLRIAPERRVGRVFRPMVPGQQADMRLDTCSKFIERVGHKAGVVEDERPPKHKGEEPKRKFASAHSFRRAFGTRWSKLLKPQELQVLMRHASIQTTLKFYVDTDADTVETAMEKLQQRQGPNTSTNTLDKPIAEIVETE